MKFSRLFFVLLPFAPLIGLLAPMTASSIFSGPGFLPYMMMLTFFLCYFFYLPVYSLAHTLRSFFPDLSGPHDFSYFICPACVLQSLLLSILVYRRFRRST